MSPAAKTAFAIFGSLGDFILSQHPHSRCTGSLSGKALDLCAEGGAAIQSRRDILHPSNVTGWRQPLRLMLAVFGVPCLQLIYATAQQRAANGTIGRLDAIDVAVTWNARTVVLPRAEETPWHDDEVAELGRAFDRMLEELGKSRARVEFLRRVSEWQAVARRRRRGRPAPPRAARRR